MSQKIIFLIFVSLTILLNFEIYEFKSIKSKRASVGLIWPSRKIPYAFSNLIEFGVDKRRKIKTALNEIEEALRVDGEACIEFVERHNNENYILFVDKGDCSSGIGYYKGKNQISLENDCMDSSTIKQQVLLRLGFYNEHTSNWNNSSERLDFNLDSENPYDFNSIVNHKDWVNIDQPDLSKIPVLVPRKNEEKIENMSPIDIYKFQSLYNCEKIDFPDIQKEKNSFEIITAEKIKNRFKLETEFKSINEDLMEKYFNKSYNICGVNHYWPLDYPLIESNSDLYKLNCLPKKEVTSSCRFSIECKDDNSICVRPFFKKYGLCVRPNNESLNEASQKVNDFMFEYGKKVKQTFSNIKKKIFG